MGNIYSRTVIFFINFRARHTYVLMTRLSWKFQLGECQLADFFLLCAVFTPESRIYKRKDMRATYVRGEWRGKLKVRTNCRAYSRPSAVLEDACNFRRLNPRDAGDVSGTSRPARSRRRRVSRRPLWRKFSIFLHKRHRGSVSLLSSFPAFCAFTPSRGFIIR